jgi:hypothetical protein
VLKSASPKSLAFLTNPGVLLLMACAETVEPPQSAHSKTTASAAWQTTRSAALFEGTLMLTPFGILTEK